MQKKGLSSPIYDIYVKDSEKHILDLLLLIGSAPEVMGLFLVETHPSSKCNGNPSSKHGWKHNYANYVFIIV